MKVIQIAQNSSWALWGILVTIIVTYKIGLITSESPYINFLFINFLLCPAVSLYILTLEIDECHSQSEKIDLPIGMFTLQCMSSTISQEFYDLSIWYKLENKPYYHIKYFVYESKL